MLATATLKAQAPPAWLIKSIVLTHHSILLI